jgi:alkylation response protein AidB-like acyl-CoA dehydrogenase
MNVAVTTRNADVLIERARSLVPALRARAAETSALRKLPQATIDDFRRLELTRCLQPAMFGGYGSTYRVFSKMLRTLAQGCGSSAWVAAVHGEHNWIVGNFSEQAQREVWGSNPHTVASASFPPTGTAEKIPGGYRINGKWGFASGVDYAQWILLNAVEMDGDRRVERMCLVPIGQVQIVDDWNVMGLAGTGSKSVVVKDVTVADSNSVTLHDLKSGQTPGAAFHRDNPLYSTPRSALASFSLSSVNVGLAERAVEEFTAISRDRRSRGQKVADFESVQIVVAEAAAKADTAVMLVEQTIDRNTRSMEAGEGIGIDQVASTRRNSTYATKLSLEAVQSLFHIAGGSALFAGHPLHDVFRDTMAGCAHLSLAWHRAAPLYGALRLGQPVDFDLL